MLGTARRALAEIDVEGRVVGRVGRWGPPPLVTQGRELAGGGGVVGEEADAAGCACITGGPGKAEGGPGAEHAPSVDQYGLAAAHPLSSEGWREARAESRIGTGPKSRSRLI